MTKILRKYFIVNVLIFSFIFIASAQACTYNDSSDSYWWDTNNHWSFSTNINFDFSSWNNFFSSNNIGSVTNIFNGNFDINKFSSLFGDKFNFEDLWNCLQNNWGEINFGDIINFCKENCPCQFPCNGGGSPVPIPSSLLLLLSAFPFFLFFNRKKREEIS